MDGFVGRIEIRPALNEAERTLLRGLAHGRGTIRGTPPGRGRHELPFAQSKWTPCPSGCCLAWPYMRIRNHLAPTMRFLVDHLLGPGAAKRGRALLPGFTFDHVLDGIVAGPTPGSEQLQLVRVQANNVSHLLGPLRCPEVAEPGTADDDGAGLADDGWNWLAGAEPNDGPANVIAFPLDRIRSGEG